MGGAKVSEVITRENELGITAVLDVSSCKEVGFGTINDVDGISTEVTDICTLLLVSASLVVATVVGCGSEVGAGACSGAEVVTDSCGRLEGSTTRLEETDSELVMLGSAVLIESDGKLETVVDS